MSNVRRTEGPERGLGVRGLSRREFLRLAGVGAGAAAFPGLLAGCGGDQQHKETRQRRRVLKASSRSGIGASPTRRVRTSG